MIESTVNGTTIRQLREQFKISQETLAADINLTRKVIKAIENNKRPGVRLETIVKLSRYFNVSIECLLKTTHKIN